MLCLGMVSVLLALMIVGVFAFRRLRRQKVYLGYQFHFLIMETENIEVGAFDAQLDGGAGALLTFNDNSCVALSVYFNEKVGREICQELQKTDKDYKIITLSVDNLEIRKGALEIAYAFRTFYQCLSLLEREVFRLDKGATQQSSKRVLSEIKAQFSFLARSYVGTFPEYGNLCAQTAEGIEALIVNDVYVKDLRKVLCEACYGYVRLSEDFSL